MAANTAPAIHQGTDWVDIHWDKAKGSEDGLRDIYKNWAPKYDKDVQSVIFEVAPEIGATALDQYLQKFNFDKKCQILDIGAGTGLVGLALERRGYSVVDAVEPCEEMLKFAKEKKVYRKAMTGKLSLTEPMSISDKTYDAAICIGVFTVNHVTGRPMPEMVRVVKPGGVICFSVREDVYHDKDYCFQEVMTALEQQGKWKQLSKSREQYRNISRSNEEQIINHFYLFVYQIL